MPGYALDHVFVCCSFGGAEAELLARAGLREGSSNAHPGQGTTCRRFFFSNAYLELLWVSNAQEAGSATSAPTRLLERWCQRSGKASPFGIALRPAQLAADTPPPFETWAYTPPFLPPGMTIDMAAGAPLTEPEMLYLGFAKPPLERPPAAREPLAHPLGASEVTAVTITTRFGLPSSPAARALVDQGVVAFSPGDTDCLHLELDGHRSSRELDLRPQLALQLRW